MFTRPPGDKAYACFMRRYDAEHLAQHPKQKVAAMKLLVATEIREGENTLGYSFRLGVKYRHRAGDFDSSGYCNHAISEDKPSEIRFACGVDCEDGGINVALSKDNKSAIIRPERIMVWKNNKPDDDASEALLAKADDRIFRLDRVDTAGWGLAADRPQGIGSAASQVITFGGKPEEAMHRRNMLQGAVSAFAGVVAAVSARAATETPDQRKLKIVYHLSDLEKVSFVMGNVQNHLDGVGGPDHVTIALVVHGPALKAFHATGANPDLALHVGRFSEVGIELAACGNTMRAQNVTLSDLLSGFVVADKGGVVRIAELQSQGYLYLRP